MRETEFTGKSPHVTNRAQAAMFSHGPRIISGNRSPVSFVQSFRGMYSNERGKQVLQNEFSADHSREKGLYVVVNVQQAVLVSLAAHSQTSTTVLPGGHNLIISLGNTCHLKNCLLLKALPYCTLPFI